MGVGTIRNNYGTILLKDYQCFRRKITLIVPVPQKMYICPGQKAS